MFQQDVSERQAAEPVVHVADDRPHDAAPATRIRSPRSPTTTSPSDGSLTLISHSQFWKSTAIFVLEDDTQNGVDHVDGHRSPVFVVSPYSKPGVDDTYYSQLNMVKTIEQILGIKPMNQEDYAAEPMYAAFTAQPNFAPFNLLPNQIPLTLGAPGYPSALTR